MPLFNSPRRAASAVATLAIILSSLAVGPAFADEPPAADPVSDIQPSPAAEETPAPDGTPAADDPAPDDDESLSDPDSVTPPEDADDEEPGTPHPALRLFSGPSLLLAAPTNVGCTPQTPTTVSDLSQLSFDNRAGGTSALGADGLRVAWHAAPTLTESKVAWYYPTNFPLSQLGNPTIDYSSTSGASVGQNFTISVDGVPQGNIVTEPGIADYWTTFSIPGMSPDPTFTYRKAVGTIDDFLAAYWADSPTHVVTVVAVGGSGGSGSEGVGVLKEQTAGCLDLTFVKPAPTNQLCSVLTPVTITDESQLFYDSGAGGTKSLGVSGLVLGWHAAPTLTQSKVAWYYQTNFPLSQLGNPTIDYSSTSGASVGQNFTISVDGVPQGNIVKEPGIADYWTTFSIPGMSADPTFTYRKAVGTIDDFLAAYWADSPTHLVTVVAVGGSGGSGSEGTGVLHGQTAGCLDISYAAPPVPTNQQCTPLNPVTITDGSQLFYDSRAGGSSSLGLDGLALAWHAAPTLSESKVAWYYQTNFPLSQLGNPTIDYSSTSGASVGQNFTISVDGVPQGNIVTEPGIPDYWTTFSIPGMSPDPTAAYRKAIGTIDDFLAAYWADSHSHVITVIAVGGSGGSGSEGTGVLHGQTAGCFSITFAKPAPVVTPPSSSPAPGAGPGDDDVSPASVTGVQLETKALPGDAPGAGDKPAPGTGTTTGDKPAAAELPATTDAWTTWLPWLLVLGIIILLLILWLLIFRRRKSQES